MHIAIALGKGAQKGDEFVRHFAVCFCGRVVAGAEAVEKQHLTELHTINFIVSGLFFIFFHDAQDVVIKIITHASQAADDFRLAAVQIPNGL